MITFLTSHIGGSHKVNSKRYPQKLLCNNGLVDKLTECWKNPSRVLIIGTASDCYERNDSILECMKAAFPMTGLQVQDMRIVDDRDESPMEHLSDFDVLILSGGHVPSQNAYFEHLGLKARLTHFDGILIGISAGTMNSAEIVYAHPELEGEAIDPTYQRFIPGLGITKIMVLPHYQLIKNDVLDGLRIFEDIAYPDSMGREFCALVDGSYILIENGMTTLHGEAYLISDGILRQICKENEAVSIVEKGGTL